MYIFSNERRKERRCAAVLKHTQARRCEGRDEAPCEAYDKHDPQGTLSLYLSVYHIRVYKFLADFRDIYPFAA